MQHESGTGDIEFSCGKINLTYLKINNKKKRTE